MSNRTILTIPNTAQFICTACDREWNEDVSQYLSVPSMVELEVTCNCGHSWKTILERRRYYRKNVNFYGTYKYKLDDKINAAGTMTVVDISRKGLKLKLDGEGARFERGDLLEVTFPLGNHAKNLVKRVVNVKNIYRNFLGVEFSGTKQKDTDVDDYMSQHTTI
jgi:hypothetical protein